MTEVGARGETGRAAAIEACHSRLDAGVGIRAAGEAIGSTWVVAAYDEAMFTGKAPAGLGWAGPA